MTITNERKIDVEKGELQLTAYTFPKNSKLTWSIIKGKEFADLSNDKLTAKKNGTVLIRGTFVSDNTVFKQLEIKISNQNKKIKIKKIELRKIDHSNKIWASIFPENATNKKLEWSIIRGKKIASIDRHTGIFTLLAQTGEFVIKADAVDGSGISTTLSLIVPKKIIKLKEIKILTQNNLDSISIEKTLQLFIETVPPNASKKVTWAIENGKYNASITNYGEVIPIKAGEVIVVAVASNGIKSKKKITIYDIKIPLNPIKNFKQMSDTIYTYLNKVYSVLECFDKEKWNKLSTEQKNKQKKVLNACIDFSTTNITSYIIILKKLKKEKNCNENKYIQEQEKCLNILEHCKKIDEVINEKNSKLKKIENNIKNLEDIQSAYDFYNNLKNL